MGNRYKSVRRYMMGEEDPTMPSHLFRMTKCILGHWEETPPGLQEAFRELLEKPPADPEEFVLLTSFTIVEDIPWPAGAIYRSDDVNLNGDVRIDQWDRLCRDQKGLLPKKDLIRKFQLMSPDARRELYREGSRLPKPVPWGCIENPIDVQVDSIRSAAFLLARCLQDRFRGKWAYIPRFIRPIGPEKLVLSAHLYAELSRYQRLIESATLFTVDTIGSQIREDIEGLAEMLALDEDFVDRLLEDSDEDDDFIPL